MAHCLRAILPSTFLEYAYEAIGKYSEYQRFFLCKFMSPGAVSLVLSWPCGRPAQSTVSCDYTSTYLKTNKQVSAGLALCNRMKATRRNRIPLNFFLCKVTIIFF